MRLVSFQRCKGVILISNAMLYAGVTFLLGVIHHVWLIVLIGPLLFLAVRLIPTDHDTDNPGQSVLLIYWGTWIGLSIVRMLWPHVFTTVRTVPGFPIGLG